MLLIYFTLSFAVLRLILSFWEAFVEILYIFWQGYRLQQVDIGLNWLYLIFNADILVHLDWPVWQEIRNTRPLIRVQLKALMDYLCKLIGIYFRNRMKTTPHDVFVKIVHATSSKRRPQSCHLVYDAPQRPNIWLFIVRPILPNLRTRVVRSPRLCTD